jgi:hypothetical protein
MKKTLIVATSTVVGVIAALWWQSGQSAPAAAAIDARTPTVARVAPASARPALAATDDEDAELPIRPQSDAFWSRIDESYKRRLLGLAADCYRGGKDRKQKLKLGYRMVIQRGVVSVHDVRAIESTLGDEAVERCMRQAVASARFEDAVMPDWATPSGQEELLLVRVGSLGRFR